MNPQAVCGWNDGSIVTHFDFSGNISPATKQIRN
jgi:hypothetical protein